MTHDDDKLPALPMRSISTQLTDDDLDRLDMFRRTQEEIPSRSAILREAVRLYLDLQEDPVSAVGGLIEGLTILYGDDDSAADLLGELQGSA